MERNKVDRLNGMLSWGLLYSLTLLNMIAAHRRIKGEDEKTQKQAENFCLGFCWAVAS